MKEERKSLTTNTSDIEIIPKEKSLLEKLTYCPTGIESEQILSEGEPIKRFYIAPEETSEIFEKVLSDE